ncbi:MAG: CDP-diacylglycerol--serine O-phosphatidyltransferase, partial [Gemmatimonadaceae bacterium]|nr:CDP-diacylglycerol--serine O-phosphatidyltransferase [Gemmatimonadaceae bacterium]
MNERFRRPPVRRAVVLFPSGLTLANLFFGVFAIVTASRGNYSQAALWVVCGAIADAFDGRVARATGTGGRFGEELDSLVDAITFGLAPAMIVYFAVFSQDNWSWIWSFLFTACAVLRLARYNVAQAGVSKRYFQGLPSPAAGITLATYFWFSQSPLYAATVDAGWPWHQLIRVVMGVLSFLMISQVPYPVVPKLSLRSFEGIAGIVFLVGGFTMLFTRKFEWFFPMATAYIAFGLLRGLWLGLIERRSGKRSEHRQDEELLDLVDDEDDIDDADVEYERDPAPPPPRRPRAPVLPPMPCVSASS